MQRLFRSSATTTQSFSSKFSESKILDKIFIFPASSMASPLIFPVNFPSRVSTSMPKAYSAPKQSAKFLTTTVGNPELIRAILQFLVFSSLKMLCKRGVAGILSKIH